MFKNKTMKKILIFFFCFFPFLVLAGTTITFRNPFSTSDFWELVGTILNILFTVALPLTLILVITGGILITTAGGNERNVELGKKCIIYSLIGLLLIIMSRGIIGLLIYLGRG